MECDSLTSPAKKCDTLSRFRPSESAFIAYTSGINADVLTEGPHTTMPRHTPNANHCWLSGLLMLLVLAGWSLQSQAEILRIGTFTAEPHISVGRDQRPAGAGVEYFRMVLQQMGMEDFVFRDYPISRLLHSLEHGDVDIALFLARTPERARKFQYPSTSFYAAQAGIAVRAESPLSRIESIADLAGYRIGVWQDAYVSPILAHPGLIPSPITGSNSVERNLRRLMTRRVDATYNPDIEVLRFKVRQLDLEDEIRLLPLPEPPTQAYPVFSRAVAAALIPRYELAVRSGQLPDYRSFLDRYTREVTPSPQATTSHFRYPCRRGQAC